MARHTLSIGDFARATHLSVKTLRHYHEAGILDPAEIDPDSGYRRYALSQLATAQLIRRFRGLELPLGDIRAVLGTTDPAVRGELIANHLRRLEAELSSKQEAVASLRDLIEHPRAEPLIEHRSIPATRVAAITAQVEVSDIALWYQGALGELHATVAAQGLTPSGVAGGIYEDALFSGERGQATMYLPTPAPVQAAGRVRALTLPAVELAIAAHEGPEEGIDRVYGALAEHVARHALAVPGPIHEFYPVGRQQTADSAAWRTEVGWPIFRTGPDGSRPERLAV